MENLVIAVFLLNALSLGISDVASPLPPTLKAPEFPVLANWDLSLPFPAAGIFEARFKNTPACLLVTEYLCFVNNYKLSGIRGLHAHGGWYSPLRHIDLSKFNISHPMCGWNAPAQRFTDRWRRVGLFDSHHSVEKYMRGSGDLSKGHLWKPTVLISPPLVIVSPKDSHVGHFIEAVHDLAEVASHLSNIESEDVMLFFHSHEKLGRWASELAKAIFGPNLKIASRGEFYDTCFSRIIFPINIANGPETIAWLRERSYKYAKVVRPIKTKQITLVQRSSHRLIVNLKEVANSLRARFPTMPLEIVRFEEMTFSEQVQVMYRTALYVSPHGASMSNLIFLQHNSTTIEIMPYKFEYYEYMRIALRVGVKHYFWETKYLNLSSFQENCYTSGGYENWTEHQCHVNNACRSCVRDRGNFSVFLPEFDVFLGTIVV